MKRSAKIDAVTTAFERFNERDFAGALELFHPDVVHADLLVPGQTHRGRAEVLRLWSQRFADGSARAVLYETREIAAIVLAIVRYQAYTSTGSAVGSPMIVAHRFAFDGDLIVRVDATILEEMSEDAVSLFLQSA